MTLPLQAIQRLRRREMLVAILPRRHRALSTTRAASRRTQCRRPGGCRRWRGQQARRRSRACARQLWMKPSRIVWGFVSRSYVVVVVVVSVQRGGGGRCEERGCSRRAVKAFVGKGWNVKERQEAEARGLETHGEKRDKKLEGAGLAARAVFEQAGGRLGEEPWNLGSPFPLCSQGYHGQPGLSKTAAPHPSVSPPVPFSSFSPLWSVATTLASSALVVPLLTRPDWAKGHPMGLPLDA